MDRARFPLDEPSADNHALETDIMRFVAIIGMVLWIIFAIAKSIPFHPSKTDASPSVQAKEPSSPWQPTPFTPSKKSLKKKEQAQQQKEKATGAENPEAGEPNAVPEGPEGLHIQFTTLGDLQALMAGGKVRIFCRARTTGFDLLFEGHALDGAVTFKGTEYIPSVLWEIKSGKDHEYFLNRLTDTFPAIRSFPLKQILLVFTDKDLQQRVEQTVARLENAGKAGIISIGRKGDIIFQGQPQKKP